MNMNQLTSNESPAAGAYSRPRGPTFAEKVAEKEAEEKVLLKRLKAAFAKQSGYDIYFLEGGIDGVDVLEKELMGAIQAYRRKVNGWCLTCGPRDDESYDVSRCTNCFVAKKRAPKQYIPPRHLGGAQRYGKKVYQRKQCEDCNAKQATCGTADQLKKRWCSGCGAAYGAMDLVRHTQQRSNIDCCCRITCGLHR